jgi:hypothetical protein
MMSLSELGAIDKALRPGEFSTYIRCLAAGRGNRSNAAMIAEGTRAPERVQRILKSPVAGVDPASLTDYRLLVYAFFDQLRTTSVFYRMLADNALVRLPFSVRIGRIASGATAEIVQAGESIPVTSLQLADGVTLERRKAAGLLVVTQELLDAGGTAVEGLISRNLRTSVGQAVDLDF